MSQENTPLQQDFLQSSASQGPLTQKARKDILGLFSFLTFPVSQEFEELSQETHAALENFLDRSPEDKDCLKALALIELGHGFIGHPFLYDEMSRYESEYSPQLSAMAHDLVRGHVTQDNVQIGIALTIATFNKASPDNDMYQAESIPHIRAAVEDLESRYAPDSAPRLLQALKDAAEKAILVCQQSAPQNKLPHCKP